MKLPQLLSLDRTLGGVMIFCLDNIAKALGRTLNRDHTLTPKGDILVVKMLGGGSLIMAMPALLGIRSAYPQHKIRLFTTRAVQPFAETMGVFDQIHVLDQRSLPRMILSGLTSLLKCMGHDTVLDLEVYSNLSTVFSLFTFARNRLGFFFEESGYRQRLHTHKVFFHPSSPVYAHYDRLATLIGAPIASMESCALQMRQVLALPRHVPASSRMIAIGSSCSDLSATVRKLTPQQWAQHIFAKYPDKTQPVVFLGAANDSDEAAAIIQAMQEAGIAWQGKIENLCGTLALADSLRLLAGCAQFWGIDSSLLHYARLFGLQVRAFFGPTDPATRLRPIAGAREDIVYRKTLCSPCVHVASWPPCQGQNICMQWLFDDGIDEKDVRAAWLPMVTDCRRT